MNITLNCRHRQTSKLMRTRLGATFIKIYCAIRAIFCDHPPHMRLTFYKWGGGTLFSILPNRNFSSKNPVFSKPERFVWQSFFRWPELVYPSPFGPVMDKMNAEFLSNKSFENALKVLNRKNYILMKISSHFGHRQTHMLTNSFFTPFIKTIS